MAIKKNIFSSKKNPKGATTKIFRFFQNKNKIFVAPFGIIFALKKILFIAIFLFVDRF